MESGPLRKETVPRLKMKEEYFKKYGWTEGCEGSRVKPEGRPSNEQRKHKEACRKRIREAMEQDEEGRRILEKDRQRITRRLAEEVERRVRAQADETSLVQPTPAAEAGEGRGEAPAELKE